MGKRREKRTRENVYWLARDKGLEMYAEGKLFHVADFSNSKYCWLYGNCWFLNQEAELAMHNNFFSLAVATWSLLHRTSRRTSNFPSILSSRNDYLGTNPNSLEYLGKFYVCGASASAYNKDKDNVNSEKQRSTQQNSIFIRISR